MTRLLNTLVLGGCMTHWPIRYTTCAEGKLAYDTYGHVGMIHTFGEMVQTIDILKGRTQIPKEIKQLWHMPPQLGAAKSFDDLDVALVEPASPTELMFRGYVINRLKVKTKVLTPLKDNPAAALIGAKWLRKGLIEMDEPVREATSAALLPFITGTTERDELVRAIITETRARKSDIANGFRKVQELLGCPIGVVAYIFRFMPDGRPISWPAGFRDQVIAAARETGFPIYDPAPLVVKFGVEEALAEDSRHYKQEFLPVIGEELVRFAQTVYAESRSNAAA